MISNSGKGENGWRNQQAGDQTGGEWCLRAWYSYPWNCVLRHPSEAVRATICNLHIKAAQNDNIGYDMNDRGTYEAALKAAGDDPSRVSKKVESDCSAGVLAHVRAAGRLLGDSKLSGCKATYTGNMRSILKECGFQVLTESKYLTSEVHLLPGDILLNDAHHTCVEVGTGTLLKVGVTSGTSSPAAGKPTSAQNDPAKLEIARLFDSSAKAGKKFTVKTKDGSGLNMRVGAGTGKGKITTIPEGGQVQWFGYYNNGGDGARWYLVVYGGYTGYVHSGYLK